MAQAPFWAIIGPSAVGKSTLEMALLERVPDASVLHTYTTRPMRPAEKDGETYRFVSRDEFKHMQNIGQLLTCAENFGNFYGTSRQDLDNLRQTSSLVLAILNPVGAEQARQVVPDLQVICLMPDQVGVVAARLVRERAARGASDEDLARRMEAIDGEIEDARRLMSQMPWIYHVITNSDGKFPKTIERVLALIGFKPLEAKG